MVESWQSMVAVNAPMHEFAFNLVPFFANAPRLLPVFHRYLGFAEKVTPRSCVYSLMDVGSISPSLRLPPSPSLSLAVPPHSCLSRLCFRGNTVAVPGSRDPELVAGLGYF